ncbi:UDP-3-O-(3-hydroxymyristoyl)glucosamine N-acyltransferase [Thiovibrio frasassiensis]|uniref:UDP-3-O-acylglucosamine N-acyltransferase n=1 Tax=Thiovibrio frasassiensis TaxID=2984131 RepID=A0A9X4RMG7_9BACT|nr:UDP-3-O-(3-hydroxymyristoyl)glucosamine N-acyltransferase [Thiovibrio frasassiensis]MDG4476345.1 UDP-3-O-(3-hydroxymyristoyl)glucosamine N-acyltransferase [Thiovibrio frasassiensis]
MAGKKIRLAELVVLVQGELVGDPELLISGVADFDSAGEGEITFVADLKRGARLDECKGSAIIVPLAVTEISGSAIRVKNPYLAVARIHALFVEEPFVATGVDARAVVGDDCHIPAEVAISPLVFIGNRVHLGQRVTLHPGVVVYDDAVIGDDVVLYANVTIGRGCRIGNRVIIHSGAVIGSDGFGYATDGNGHHLKRPQVGVVQIDDDVEIGANTCIDRATFGRTWVKRGTKIDNLVQLGHNVVIGEDALLVAQVGMAGSTTTGNNVVIGGQVGLGGHIHLGDRVMIAAKSGVHNNLEPGSIVAGIPAIPHKNWLRASAAYAKLPDMVREMRELKKKVAELSRAMTPGRDDSPGNDA